MSGCGTLLVGRSYVPYKGTPIGSDQSPLVSMGGLLPLAVQTKWCVYGIQAPVCASRLCKDTPIGSDQLLSVPTETSSPVEVMTIQCACGTQAQVCASTSSKG